jgi:hypothetical protein
MNPVVIEPNASTPPSVLAISGNQYFRNPLEGILMAPANHPRFSAIQLEAVILLTRGDLQLTNRGQYALIENGEVNEELTVRKPVLKALADKGLAEFKEVRNRLVYRITAAGREAAKPDSLWRRPVQPPGRAPKPAKTLPDLKPKPSGAARKGVVVCFVKHPLAEGKAFATVKEACEYARRIQAGYAKRKEEVPSLTVEHRRYVAFSQKLLVKALNGETSDEDVIETWETLAPAYTNMKTYQRYEPIGD